MTQDKLSKLPKWAQDEINQRQAKIEYLEQMLSEFNGKTETNTFIRHLLISNPLPNNSDVEFYIGKNKLSVRVDGDCIAIRSNSNNDMLIMPRASNSFNIVFH
jgi:hypothetical protein